MTQRQQGKLLHIHIIRQEHTHTHTHAHARTHARTHAHTHTHTHTDTGTLTYERSKYTLHSIYSQLKQKINRDLSRRKLLSSRKHWRSIVSEKQMSWGYRVQRRLVLSERKGKVIRSSQKGNTWKRRWNQQEKVWYEEHDLEAESTRA